MEFAALVLCTISIFHQSTDYNYSTIQNNIFLKKIKLLRAVNTTMYLCELKVINKKKMKKSFFKRNHTGRIERNIFIVSVTCTTETE